MSFGPRLFVFLFPALLPPVDPDEQEYYAALGVSPSANVDAIRKGTSSLASIRVYVCGWMDGWMFERVETLRFDSRNTRFSDDGGFVLFASRDNLRTFSRSYLSPHVP